MYESQNSGNGNNKQDVHRSLNKAYNHISHETKRIRSLVSNFNSNASTFSVKKPLFALPSSSSAYKKDKTIFAQSTTTDSKS